MKKLRVRMPDGKYELHEYIDWYVLDDGGLVIRRANTSSRYAPGGWWEITDIDFGDENDD